MNDALALQQQIALSLRERTRQAALSLIKQALTPKPVQAPDFPAQVAQVQQLPQDKL